MQFRRFVFALIVGPLTVACGGDSKPSTPTSPSTVTPPTPAVTASSVSVAASGCSSGNCTFTGQTAQLTATARMSDGSSQNVTNTAEWSSTNPAALTVSNTGVLTSRGVGGADILAVYQGKMGGITVTVPPLWNWSGSGARVGDMPTYVSRVKIAADYGGRCENFAVRVGGRLVVNIIMGTCSVADYGSHFDGTYAVIGGQVEVSYAAGISWSITELR